MPVLDKHKGQCFAVSPLLTFIVHNTFSFLISTIVVFIYPFALVLSPLPCCVNLNFSRGDQYASILSHFILSYLCFQILNEGSSLMVKKYVGNNCKWPLQVTHQSLVFNVKVMWTGMTVWPPIGPAHVCSPGWTEPSFKWTCGQYLFRAERGNILLWKCPC